MSRTPTKQDKRFQLVIGCVVAAFAGLFAGKIPPELALRFVEVLVGLFIVQSQVGQRFGQKLEKSADAAQGA